MSPRSRTPGWFRGIYQNPKNAFPQLAVDTDTWFEMYRDLWTVPDDQLARWKADRIGAIVGSRLIERFGWKIGDRIPLQSAMWPKAGGGAWEFIVDGVYSERMAGKTSRELMFFHYTYLNDARALGRDLVDSSPRSRDKSGSRERGCTSDRCGVCQLRVRDDDVNRERVRPGHCRADW